jgi:hypothetical protein
MQKFEGPYSQFQITAEQKDNLRQLSEPWTDHTHATSRVVVEAVFVENGERRVVEMEEQGAKLV